MNFNKCEHCNHKKICKFIEPLRKLQLYTNDWIESYEADDIINIDIDCQGCEENKNKLHIISVDICHCEENKNKSYIDKNIESSPVKFYSGTSPVVGTESDSSKNVIY